MTTRSTVCLLAACGAAACSSVDVDDAVHVHLRRGSGDVVGAPVVFHQGDVATIETTAGDGIARGYGDAITVADPFPITVVDSFVDVLTVVDLDAGAIVAIDLGPDELGPAPVVTVTGTFPGADFYDATPGCPATTRSTEEGVYPWCAAAGTTDVIAVAHGASPGKLQPPTVLGYAAIPDVALDGNVVGTATVSAWSTACTDVPLAAVPPLGGMTPFVSWELVWRGRAFPAVCPSAAVIDGLALPTDVPVESMLVTGVVAGPTAVSIIERRDPAGVAEVRIDGPTDLIPLDLIGAPADRADPRRPVVGWTAGPGIARVADAAIVTMTWDTASVSTHHMTWRVLATPERVGFAFPALPADFAALAPDASSEYLGWNVRYVDASSITGWLEFRWSMLPMSGNAAGDPLAWPGGTRLRTLRSQTRYEP